MWETVQTLRTGVRYSSRSNPVAKTTKRSSLKPKAATPRQPRPTYTELRTALEACAERIDNLVEIDKQIEQMVAMKGERRTGTRS